MLIVEVDNYRLLRSFEAIGRALYFHMYSEQFIGICRVIPAFIRENIRNSKWNKFCDLCFGATKKNVYFGKYTGVIRIFLNISLEKKTKLDAEC